MPNATDYYAVSSNEAIIPPPSTIQVKRIKSKLHRSKSKERKASKTNANKVAGVVVGKVAMASPNLNKTEKYCIEPNYKKKLLTNHHKKISPNRHDQTFHHPSYCGSGSAHDMIRRVVAPLNMVQKQDARLAHNSSLSFSNYRVATAKPNTSRAPSPPMSSRIINDSQENDDIDWNRDDDAFFLLASDVLEQLSPHNTSIDPEKLEQILPQSMRNIFIQSIRHRMDLLPIKPDKMESQTDRITRKCQSLWLASFDPLLNPLLQSQSINSEVQSKQAHDLNKRSETHTTSMITSYSTNDIVKKKEPELMNQLVQVRKLLAGSKTEPSTSFWKRQVELLEEQIQSLRSSNDNNVTSTLNPQKQQERQPQLQQNGVTNENKTLKRHPSSPCPYVPLTDENNEIKSFSEPTVVFPPSKNEKGTAKVTPMVNIIAPADLPGGYTFEAYVGGTKILAKVPPGGVIKGQMFTTPMESLDEIRTTVKIGDWRDGICDCFSHGLCHSLFLCTLFFPQSKYCNILCHFGFYEFIYNLIISLFTTFFVDFIQIGTQLV